MDRPYHIKPYGDRALMVSFPQKIDPSIHRQVGQLESWIKQAGFSWYAFSIPAYCSWVLGYDPGQMRYAQLKVLVEQALMTNGRQQIKVGQHWELPVCYESEFGPDLEEIGDMLGLTAAEIIQLHTSQSYHIYMLGFLPGFAYMGNLPAALNAPRKGQPMVRVPAQSVAIAGTQTSIYPLESPGGWQLIGRCPVPVLRPNEAQFCLYQAGDEVRFYPITAHEFELIAHDARSGTLKPEQFAC